MNINTNYSRYIASLYKQIAYNDNVHEMNINSDHCKLSKIALDKYQRFVSQYLFTMKPSDVHGMLLYHNTGSGKTCTSINIIRKYFDNFSKKDIVYVIVPSHKDVVSYTNAFVKECPSFKNSRFESKQSETHAHITNQNQHIIVLEFKVYARARSRGTVTSVPGISPNSNPFLNTLVIIDEADTILQCERAGYTTPEQYKLKSQGTHGVLSATQVIFDDASAVEVSKANNRPVPLMNYGFGNNDRQNYEVKKNHKAGPLINHPEPDKEAHNATRILVLMTGTPYVNDPNDIFHLLKMIRPRKSSLDLFVGTISYVDNRTDYRLFPKVTYQPIPIHVNANLENRMRGYINTHAFNNIEKETSVECFGPSCKSGLTKLSIDDMPKMMMIQQAIRSYPDTAKHLIYVHEKHAGSRVVEYMLKQLMPDLRVKSLVSQKPNTSILQEFNSDSNKHGKHIQVLIIQGKAFVRASTFKAVRALHILNPLLDPNEHNQLLGRVVRRCSHSQLDIEERTVSVLFYHIDTPNRRSANERITTERMRKQTAINEMIEYAKHYAVDRDVYNVVNNQQKKSLINL